MNYKKIQNYISNYNLSEQQKQNLLKEKYFDTENDRLTVYGIIYNYLHEQILNKFKLDINEDDTLGDYINDIVNNLVLKYVFSCDE